MTVTYTTDYRSLAEGCGTIETENGDLILIQDKSYNPPVYGGIYHNIILIPFDFGEEYEKAQAKLIEILRNHNVTEVHDYELCDQNIDNYKGDGIITVNVFDKFRQL